MVEVVGTRSDLDLASIGLGHLGRAYWNLSTPQLIEHILRGEEGALGRRGTILVNTGKHTGRSPRDKFTVEEQGTQADIWWGEVNKPMSEEAFGRLHRRMTGFFEGRHAYILDAAAGADPNYRMPIRVVTEQAWHSLFSRHLFLSRNGDVPRPQEAAFTILHAPSLKADPGRDGTNSEAFIVLNLAKRLALIGGTLYAGEIKKTIFTVLNYTYPKRDVLTMHCSANVGADGDVALFFGLSGTGKTTLSSDPNRSLIGDDEHAWGESGIFNLEGGCYAKLIRLDPQAEPIIWRAAQRFSSVLENVVYDPESREVDFYDDRLTENTRGAYPIHHVPNHVTSGQAGHPRHIFFLSADAFGVLPPISKLTPEQAMYYFLSGYTSKLAGTEKGLGSEPQATFSACFASPFLPLAPSVYAEMLGERTARHRTKIWLVNTGWTGGAYGVGERIRLSYTRAMIQAAMAGGLEGVSMRRHPVFGLQYPEHCPDVPDEVLEPRSTWEHPDRYDQQARNLARRFAENFAQYEGEVSAEVREIAPKAEA